MQDGKDEFDNVVILDEHESSAYPREAPIQSVEEIEDDVKRRAINTLRGQKISQTRKANTVYRRNVRNALRALVSGTYCTLNDGTELDGADILAITLFERAAQGDVKASKLILETTGDLSKTEEEEKGTSIEEYLKSARPVF